MKIVLTPDEARYHILRSLGLAKEGDLKTHSSGMTVLITPHVVIWEDAPRVASDDIPDDCYRTDAIDVETGP